MLNLVLVVISFSFRERQQEEAKKAIEEMKENELMKNNEDDMVLVIEKPDEEAKDSDNMSLHSVQEGARKA